MVVFDVILQVGKTEEVYRIRDSNGIKADVKVSEALVCPLFLGGEGFSLREIPKSQSKWNTNQSVSKKEESLIVDSIFPQQNLLEGGSELQGCGNERNSML